MVNNIGGNIIEPGERECESDNYTIVYGLTMVKDGSVKFSREFRLKNYINWC